MTCVQLCIMQCKLIIQRHDRICKQIWCSQTLELRPWGLRKREREREEREREREREEREREREEREREREKKEREKERREAQESGGGLKENKFQATTCQLYWEKVDKALQSREGKETLVRISWLLSLYLFENGHFTYLYYSEERSFGNERIVTFQHFLGGIDRLLFCLNSLRCWANLKS